MVPPLAVQFEKPKFLQCSNNLLQRDTTVLQNLEQLSQILKVYSNYVAYIFALILDRNVEELSNILASDFPLLLPCEPERFSTSQKMEKFCKILIPLLDNILGV